MTLRHLHRDWPIVDDESDRWDIDGPAAELLYALSPDEATFATATGPAQPCDGFTVADVAAVTRYFIESNGQAWRPGGEIGTELEMYLVLQLTDGRWAAVEAANDYTGWGCRSGADIRIGATEAQVVEFGLSSSGRTALGYEADQ